METIKILIADDEPMIRDGLSEMINGYGKPYTIVGKAKNGLEALNLAKMLEPDIILTDIYMPKLSGLDFIKQLKACGNLGKIIIISGFNEFDYARQAISLGVSEYLLKPINEVELKRTVEVCSGVKACRRREEKSEEISIVERCLSILKTEFTDSCLDLGVISGRISVNPDYLSRKLKNETGLSFKEWITKLRIQRSLELLHTQKYTVYEVAELVGYSSQHYFSTAFKNYTGRSPKHFREIDYAKI